jgi:ADP-ribose pyrophosphatase YjhB (NUDIX family)
MGTDPTDAERRARELHEEARSDPEAVDLTAVGDLLTVDDPRARQHALHALSDLAGVRPDEVVGLLPEIRKSVGDEDRLVKGAALSCLATLAEHLPERVTSAAPEVLEALDPTASDAILEAAVRYVASVADAEPATVRDGVPAMAAVLSDPPPSVERPLLAAMRRIATDYPEAVLPAVPDLVGRIEAGPGAGRTPALAVLDAVAKAYPHAARDLVSEVSALLDDEDPTVGVNAAGLLVNLADQYPGAVATATDDLVAILEAEDDTVRANAAAALASIAESEPGEVAQYLPALLDRFDDDVSGVRTRAVLAVGYVLAAGDDAAPADVEYATVRSRLEELGENDSSEKVRKAARWALRPG